MKLDQIHHEIGKVVYDMVAAQCMGGLRPKESKELIDEEIKDHMKEGEVLHKFMFMEKDVYEYAHEYWLENYDTIADDMKGHNKEKW